MGRTGTGVNVRPNSIRVTFTFEGEQQHKTLTLNGKPMAPTPANIKYAERLAAEIREKVRLGSFSMAEYFPASGDTKSGNTVAIQLDAWLSAQRIESSTKAGYSSAIKFWKNVVCDARGTLLGDLALRALKHSHILTALASRPDLTGKTVNNYVSVLRESMAMALKDKLISENPVAEIPRAKHQKPPPDPFTREESENIIASFHERHAGQATNLIEFWFWTGMRTSEIFGLQWANVDLASGTVLVAEAMVRGERKDSTKTDTVRTVKLNSRALAALQRQRKHTQVAGAEVFQDPRYDSAWVEERAFRRSYWTPTLKLLGIRYRRPYNMRHSYATAMLMAGMTPAFCAKQLGHSVEMFLRTYSKWLDGDQNDLEMQRLESTLSGNLCPEYAQKGKGK
jgi:integrase